ncbi:synaptogenesis protein syg-2-like [Mytilus californianus]|uniref:synaptogenesis protein syg-2-like n=1 Tax=Mytilus californianus TaxID=6549 RepID=UPI002245A67A|nr:synaptogenesis protein syg-2-like [Mytilus californianus]
MQNMSCYAVSDLLISPLSRTIYLDIQYRPYLTIIQRNKGSITEGESVELCCHSNSNPHVHYIAWLRNNHEILFWRQNGTTYFDELNKDFCLPINSVYRNHTGNYTCFAENIIAKSNSSIAINVLYPPDVKVAYAITEQRITLLCIPYGTPDNYTFYDWEHRSEFNEHIRGIHGTPEGQLIINKSQIRKANEDDGIYVCTVSNGVSNQKGKFSQEGQVCIESSVSPVFVADNTPVQIGQYGKIVTLTIKVYDKLYNSQVFIIKKNGATVGVKPTIENITTHDTFYGVKIRVAGIQFTFHLHLTSANDFTSYIVEARNDVGCNYFYVRVQSESCPEPPSNVSVKATGQIVTVSWIPGFNGGFDQEFFLEFGTDFSLNFTVRVPEKETKEEKMDHSLDNLSPNTAYFICIFSKNKKGDSNKTDYVAFVTPQVSQEESTLHRKLIALPVVTTIGLCLTIGIGIFLYIKQKAKGSFGTNISGTEDEYASDTQGNSVENRLYQSAECLDPETRRGEAELDNPIASSSHDNQLYQMQMQTYNENDGKSLQCALVQKIEKLPVEPMSKIIEADLNYAEIVFEDRQLPGPVIIHGIDDKTIYSDIVIGDQFPNLLSTNDSSSESEDDFIYVDGIENYTERRKMNASQQ